MKIGCDGLANIRVQVLNSIPNSLEVEDIIFCVSYHGASCRVQQALIPYENIDSFSDKYFARKQVVEKLVQRSLHPELSKADELFFFSFDVPYNVDYCYHLDLINEIYQLIIYRKDGTVIFSNQYDCDFDERPFLYSEVISKDLIEKEPNTISWNCIKGLFHLTHIDNLESIIEKGLLSHTISHSMSIIKEDISNKLVQVRRKHIHNKVPLYFNILNPMTYTYSINEKKELLVFKVNKKIMLNPGTLFTDGNAASSSTKYYSSLIDLDQLDWSFLNSKFWNNYPDGKRKKCAEVLIPHNIPTKFITDIFIYNKTLYKKISDTVSDLPISVSVNKEYFF